MADKKEDTVLELVKSIKDTIDNQGTELAETREQLKKMGEDLVAANNRIDGISKSDTAAITTAEPELDDKGQPIKRVVQLKPVFQGEEGSVGFKGALSRYFYVETDKHMNHINVRRMLYAPRTDWNLTKRCYEEKRSYDNLEDIMELNDMAYFAATAIAHREKRPYGDIMRELDSWKLLNQEIQANSDLKRALDTADSSDFVPTQFSARLLDDVRLMLRVAALFPRLALPRSPFQNPVRGSRQVAYLVAQATSDTASKIPTSDPIAASVTFTAIKFAVRNLFSDEFEEDSIVPVMPWVRSELVQAMADAEEDATVNGDSTDTTHIHSDVTSANDRRKAYDGLLYHSGQSSGAAVVDISTLSTTNLRSIRKKMGRFGAQSDRLAWVVSISAYIQMLGLTEVLTAEKYLGQATVIQGELAKFDGAPVIVSEFVRQDLNATAVYDGSTTSLTELFLVHTPSFMYGDVGAAKAESDRDIETGQTIVVTSRRTSFQQIHTPGSSEETVGLGYNLTS